MTRRLRTALRLVLTVQLRAKFPHVYFGVALLAIVAFRTLIPDDLVPLALPAFLFGEPGSLGVFMVAAHRYLERAERSAVALSVTPLESREYVAALVVGSAVVPTAASAVLQGGVQGWDVRVLLVMPPLFFIAIVSGSLGLLLSTVFRDFTRFILGSIPVLFVYSLPFLGFFDLAPGWPFRWIPSDPALSMFGALARDGVTPMIYVGLLGWLAAFAGAAYWVAGAAYAGRVRRQVAVA